MTSAYRSQLSCFFPLPWAELSIVSYAAPPLVCMHACWLIATAMRRCMLAELTYVRLQLMSKKGVCCWVAMQILGRSLDIMSSPEILLPRRPVSPESKSQTLTSAYHSLDASGGWLQCTAMLVSVVHAYGELHGAVQCCRPSACQADIVQAQACACISQGPTEF